VKITDLVLVEVTGEFPPDPLRAEERIAQPLDAYPEFGQAEAPPALPAGPVTETDVFLEVHTDEGLTGFFGPVDGPHAPILRREFRDFVIGRDPLAIEKLWDLLLRRNRHARSGYYMMAMSALDCALWDLKGKALGLPVYRLLGGPVRDAVPAYASMLGFSLQPDALARRAREYQALGYRAQKWFFRWGPADGPEGAARNVALVAALRDALGDDSALMFDAFNSWDLPYAVDVGRRIAPFRPAWLEEPVPVDRLHALQTIRDRTGLPIATGEHLYTRWQVRDVLEARAADVIQADPDWCGGISELLKIAAVCSAYDVPLCPHGHSLHAALHVAAASPPNVLPQVEFLILHQRRKQRFLKHCFLQGYLEPQGGLIIPPDAPGLGLTLDPAKITSRRHLD